MRKSKTIPEIIQCRVCDKQYEEGRSRCPHCGTPRIIFQSESFIRFEVEIERAIWRAIDARRGTLSVSDWIAETIERRISDLNRGIK